MLVDAPVNGLIIFLYFPLPSATVEKSKATSPRAHSLIRPFSSIRFGATLPGSSAK